MLRHAMLKNLHPEQWHMQNIFMEWVSVAHGGHLYLVCVVCDVTI